MSYRGKFDLYRNGMGGYLSEMTMERNSDLDKYEINKTEQYWISAPTFSQSFRWFREKYKLYPEINLHDRENEESWRFEISVLGDYNLVYNQNVTKELYYKTYEEAELECLKKLIKIVKTN
jgi:hypothetical protein